MTHHRTMAHASISVMISLAVGICLAQAQSLRDLSWQQETEFRLKAIYERGEFRPKKFQAQWLIDSSGYTVQEQDPKTDKMISAIYDARTGERTESKSDDEKQSVLSCLLYTSDAADE